MAKTSINPICMVGFRLVLNCWARLRVAKSTLLASAKQYPHKTPFQKVVFGDGAHPLDLLCETSQRDPRANPAADTVIQARTERCIGYWMHLDLPLGGL
jgi:hypothetical protein